jgi:protein-disulfide isomerase
MSHLKPDVSDTDHRSGPQDAPVTLVEYGDFECPYCGQAYPIVKRVQKALGGQLRFIFRNFPLREIHPHAVQAALSAEAAGAQGRFWEMHDMLFKHQSALGDGHLMRYAEQLDLDVARFDREVHDGTYSNRVQSDFKSGVRSGVNGTPTFFINGERLDAPWDFEGLMSALERAGVREPRHS